MKQNYLNSMLLLILNFYFMYNAQCQYIFSPPISTYVPSGSEQISRILNERYEQNLKMHKYNIYMLNVLYQYHLLPIEVEAYNYNSGMCKLISERGDYENLGISILDVKYSLEPIYLKYAPPKNVETCFNKLKEIESSGTWITGYEFNDTFFSTIHFYRKYNEYFAVVTFISNTVEGIHLVEGKKYIYCGLTEHDVSAFQYYDINESYGQKFNRLIRNKKCNCN